MTQPLAYRKRPQTIDDIVGQNHLLGEGKILRKLVENQYLPSMIFYGPPGTGKTTTAIAIANSLQKPYRLFNAVINKKKDLDQLFVEAEMTGGLVVIVDEVHRLNKDKQDILLPHIESGLITMIGATTANPNFSINPAIRSRVQLFEFKPLFNQDIFNILQKATPKDQMVSDDVYDKITQYANGDARYALNTLEILLSAHPDEPITIQKLEELSVGINIAMDKDSDNYYDTLSAFQKSIRGSDVNAALYYLAKLIEVGDFDSIERRLITIAYEDIGLANPALCQRVAVAVDAARKIGFPEAKMPLSVAVIEAALSPKSKGAQYAIDHALQVIQSKPYQTPFYLRMNPAESDPEAMYSYDHPELWHQIQYLPDELKETEFYQPINLNSAEKTLAQNYETLKKYHRYSDLKKLKREKVKKGTDL